MGDHLWAGKQSWYVTDHLAQSAFRTSEVSKSSTSLSVGVKAVYLCWVEGKTVNSVIPYAKRHLVGLIWSTVTSYII